MKVRDTTPVQSQDGVEAPRAAAPAAPAERPASYGTVRSQEVIQDARAQVAQSRSARLRELKDQVRLGTYKPSPDRIATQMLNEAEVTAMLRLSLR
jgi:anti-sigma28 factor (negative regulator of flagellin synthesis)